MNWFRMKHSCMPFGSTHRISMESLALLVNSWECSFLVAFVVEAIFLSLKTGHRNSTNKSIQNTRLPARSSIFLKCGCLFCSYVYCGKPKTIIICTDYLVKAIFRLIWIKLATPHSAQETKRLGRQKETIFRKFILRRISGGPAPLRTFFRAVKIDKRLLIVSQGLSLCPNQPPHALNRIHSILQKFTRWLMKRLHLADPHVNSPITLAWIGKRRSFLNLISCPRCAK